MIRYFMPYIISFILGLLTAEYFFKGTKLNLFLKLSFAMGLGLGLSGMIAFSSFLIFQKYYPLYALLVHGILILSMGVHQTVIEKRLPSLIDLSRLPETGIFLCLLLSIGISSYLFGRFYPYGGWDAWQVWNFKAKFLFESTGEWKNMFDPVLWRSSPHYPLLLPLINVWGWTFSLQTVPLIPFMTSLIFSTATSALIFAALYELTRSRWSAVAALLPLLNAHYLILISGQYCDHVLGFFLCCAVVAFLLAMNTGHLPLFGLAGAFVGILSFTKPEGTVASGLIFLIFTALVLFQKRSWRPALWIAGFLAAFSIPMIIFKFMLSPGNQTFINGLASSSKPSSWSRVQFISKYILIELLHKKWTGLWLILCIGFLTHIKACLQKQFLAITIFLAFYTGIIVVYYWINTYFEITWWISVTLARILISILPLLIIWIGAAVLSPKD